MLLYQPHVSAQTDLCCFSATASRSASGSFANTTVAPSLSASANDNVCRTQTCTNLQTKHSMCALLTAYYVCNIPELPHPPLGLDISLWGIQDLDPSVPLQHMEGEGQRPWKLTGQMHGRRRGLMYGQFSPLNSCLCPCEDKHLTFSTLLSSVLGRYFNVAVQVVICVAPVMAVFLDVFEVLCVDVLVWIFE